MRQGQNRDRARELRSTLTEVEQRLWRELRSRRFVGWKFRRQVPIGPYIADFACMERRLVVELDGSQHAESQRDEARDLLLQDFGWRVMRFWNNGFQQNREGVLTAILEALKT
jgi:very-short-patch-repair endonuclease